MDKIKALIFDLDGVIVTTEHNHFLAWQRTAHSLGIDFEEEQNELLKGVSRADSLKKILELGSKTISLTSSTLIREEPGYKFKFTLTTEL